MTAYCGNMGRLVFYPNVDMNKTASIAPQSRSLPGSHTMKGYELATFGCVFVRIEDTKTDVLGQ